LTSVPLKALSFLGSHLERIAMLDRSKLSLEVQIYDLMIKAQFEERPDVVTECQKALDALRRTTLGSHQRSEAENKARALLKRLDDPSA
jgi:hypothetical protein